MSIGGSWDSFTQTKIMNTSLKYVGRGLHLVMRTHEMSHAYKK